MSYNYHSISNTPLERQSVIYPYCYWENAFTEKELDDICILMKQTEVSDGFINSNKNGNETDAVAGPVVNQEIRRSKVSFHSPNDQTNWIFLRLNSVIEMMNNNWYNFDINGYSEFQYTEYYDYNQGHYGWHSDIMLGKKSSDVSTETRKLSLTLLLNDPSKDFQGGELQFGHELDYESAPMKKGTIILFPSWHLHRVTPVTKGLRKSIVVWVLGPKFR